MIPEPMKDLSFHSSQLLLRRFCKNEVKQCENQTLQDEQSPLVIHSEESVYFEPQEEKHSLFAITKIMLCVCFLLCVAVAAKLIVIELQDKS